MNMIEALRIVAMPNGSLTQDEMQLVMQLIMTGQATDAQLSDFLVALAARGETPAELTGAAITLRSLATPVHTLKQPLLDTCGTGGSGKKLFNISTAVAFVAAAGGTYVSKHGNRGASSQSGSADVLECAGVPLTLEPEEITHCIDKVGVGFMFAQAHHPAVKYVAPVRAKLGIPTLFNLIGPLANPASADYQLIGISNGGLQMPLVQALQALGSPSAALVVHCDGLDEIGLNAPSEVIELRDQKISAYQVAPELVGLKRQSHDALVVDSPSASLQMLRAALSGRLTPATDIVAFNAGAAFYLTNKTSSFELGVALAQDLIASGQALEKWKEFVDFTKAVASLKEATLNRV